jgi:predicted nucleic acid-binding protein
MILLDANLLIYAVNADAPLNRKAKAWLESDTDFARFQGLRWRNPLS